MFAFVSAPIDTTSFPGSLSGNQLCGLKLGWNGVEGTYTAEGITIYNLYNPPLLAYAHVKQEMLLAGAEAVFFQAPS